MITAIVFIPSLSLHFVDWDDPEYLYKNPDLLVFKDHWSWSAIYNIFTSKVGGNYNPLPIATYAVERYFFAPDIQRAPFIFHLDNLLLHLGSTLCVFILFTKMGISRTGAFIGGLLFGIHPMRVESVAWVTERKDVLYGLFYLLALIAYTNYIRTEKNKTKWYLITVVFSIFSYFSKIQAVSLPLSMIAIDIYFNRKWYEQKIILNEKLPWWGLSILIGLINLHILNALHIINSEAQLANYGIIDKLAVGAYSYFVYLVKFIYPYRMLHWYLYPVNLPVIAYVSLGAIPVILILFLRKAYKDRELMFGWLFFTVNIIFLLQIVPAGKAFTADRFTYIAYTGLFFLVAMGYDRIARSVSIRPYLLTFIGGYIAVLAFITVNQEKVWKNTVTLWEHYIKVIPDRSFGYVQLGDLCVSAMLKDTTLNTDLTFDELKAKSFHCFLVANSIDSADQRPQKAVTLAIFQGLGGYYGAVNKYDSAEYYFTRQMDIISKEVTKDPSDKDVYADRALTFYKNKKYDLALKDYQKFLEFDPKNDGAYYRCALCEGYLGKFREGIVDINTAIVLDTTQAEYYYTRAKLYRQVNSLDSSRADAHKAKAMGANVADKWLQ